MDDSSSPISIHQIQELREENIGRLFLQAHRDFSNRAVEKLHARGHSGLSLNHTALLANLDLEGTRITTLAERASITKQSMGELVQDLEQKGYVQRTPDATDRRAVMIQFTDSGWQYLHDAYAIKREIEAEYAAIIGEIGMAALRDCLKALIGH
ncbi:MAG: MarR family transcriptional regulator [Chitinophagaceae bacterium]|nr:MarR family transcriptional regulator [Anaerolineae bacterium]